MAVDQLLQRRTHVHRLWGAVAPGWEARADEGDARVAALTDRLLVLAGVTGGDRVLELACGPGGAGLTAADRVGPTGEVVLSDVAPEMVAVAERRVRARGLEHVRTAVLDLEDIAEPDGSFDVVLCREGLMFAVEPERAAAEARRVLRPGGRAAMSVWGPKAANPWLGLVLDEVSAAVGSPVPPPGMPGPFALADARRLHDLLDAAGFGDVAVEDVAVPLRAPSFEAWWGRMTEVAGPVAALIAGMEDGLRSSLVDRLRAAAAPYVTGTGLELPGSALLATGRSTA